MKSIPANSIPTSTPNPGAPDNTKAPQLSEAAVMLLPGLHHARSFGHRLLGRQTAHHALKPNGVILRASVTGARTALPPAPRCRPRRTPMQILVPAGKDARASIETQTRAELPPPEPFQLSFLSPLPSATAGVTESVHEDDPEYIDTMRRLRRRRVRCVTKSEVEKATSGPDERAPLRTSTGEFLPPLYTRDESGAGEALKPADAATIITSADSLLAYRFRRGVKILAEPYLRRGFDLRRDSAGDHAASAAGPDIRISCGPRRKGFYRHPFHRRGTHVSCTTSKTRAEPRRQGTSPSSRERGDAPCLHQRSRRM